MKVLHIINDLSGGGAQSLLKDMVPYQIENNADVEILLFTSRGNVFDESLKKSGIIIHSLNKKSVYDPTSIFKISAYLKKYDVIHVHLFPAQYYVVLASLFVRQKPVMLFTEHGTKNNRMGKMYWRLIDKFIYSRYDKIIGVSQGVFRSITKWVNLPLEKFGIVVNGTKLIESRIKSIKSKEVIKILMIGMFNEYKDQATVIKAAALLGNKYHVIFAGSGYLESKMKDLARELDVAHRIHFFGFQKDFCS